MIPILKSEFRKLLSVCSTYVLIFVNLILVAISAFWVKGYQNAGQLPGTSFGPGAYAEVFSTTSLFVSLFGAVIAILYMAHEYRYNIIMHTLTANASRTKVLLGKIIAITTLTIIFSLLSGFVGVGLFYLGASLKGISVIEPQSFDALNLVWRTVFYNAGQVLLALMIATITRSIAAGIAIMFLLPTTIEPLLSLLLKEKAAYLPYSIYDHIVAFGGESAVPGEVSLKTAVTVSMLYLIVGWLITWFIFMRRDAN